MSNRNRKATGGSTMVDKKLKKAKAQVAELGQSLAQAQMQVMNFRMMYEGSVTERDALKAQLGRTNQMLTALVTQARGKTATIKAKTFERLAEYAGVDTKEVDGDLVLEALTVEAVQAMQADLDEFEEEGEDDA